MRSGLRGPVRAAGGGDEGASALPGTVQSSSNGPVCAGDDEDDDAEGGCSGTGGRYGAAWCDVLLLPRGDSTAAAGTGTGALSRSSCSTSCSNSAVSSAPVTGASVPSAPSSVLPLLLPPA